MSAPVSDDVLRELGAKSRTFNSGSAALHWYWDKKEHDGDLSQPLELSSGATNKEELDRDRATMAKITFCLRVFDADVDDTALLHADKLLDWLRGWNEPANLVKRWGMGDIENLYTTMRKTESTLYGRMRARGLLEDK